MYVFRCLLAYNSGKTAPGFSHGACTHEFIENKQQKSSSLTTCKEFTLTGAQRETLMFNVTVQWRIIINDPFNSPTNMNALGEFKSFTTEMLKMDTKEDQKGRQTQANIRVGTGKWFEMGILCMWVNV